MENRKKLFLTSLIVLVFGLGLVFWPNNVSQSIFAQSTGSIKLHPDNPHYFLYQNQPTVLITSGEHYGAVINLNFDYTAYLNELEDHGLNLTRVFSGDFRGGDASPTLSPVGADNFIAPWAWSGQDGGFDGRKFDLNQWNPAYFTRLKDFVQKAGSRGIVVELVLFCNQYNQERWQKSPLYHDNNIQGVNFQADFEGGKPSRYLTRDSNALNQRQRQLVSKVVTELRDFENVYFEIANEPWAYNLPASDYVPWHELMIAEIEAAESALPVDQRHMIAVNYGKSSDINTVSNSVKVINGHYINNTSERISVFKLLDDHYHLEKALSFDETMIVDHPSQDYTPESGRVESWEFMIGGGSVYDNLSFSYTTTNESGNTTDGNKLRTYLSRLKQFVESFDFIKMRKDDSTVVGGLPSGCHLRAISEPSKQYAIYMHHGQEDGYNYRVSPGSYQANLVLSLPSGSYRAEWVRPTDLAIIDSEEFTHSGGNRVLSSPSYSVDIALKIVSSSSPPETHRICQNEQCVEVSGAGADECSSDADCVSPPTCSGCGDPTPCTGDATCDSQGVCRYLQRNQGDCDCNANCATGYCYQRSEGTDYCCNPGEEWDDAVGECGVPSPPNPYDLDGDEDVDGSDGLLLIGSWGSSPSLPQADFNGDGKINALDFSLLAQNFSDQVSALPEPGLIWYSTLDSASAVTNPQVGSPGTVSSTVTFPSAQYGNGILIDDSEDDTYFPMSGNVNPNKGTIEFWYKETTNTSLSERFFASNKGSQRFCLRRKSGEDTTIQLWIEGGSKEWTDVPNVFDGAWHNIRVTYDNDLGSYYLYIDGANQGKKTGARPAIDTSGYNLYIGMGYSGAGSEIKGIIDDFKVYSE